MAKVVALFLLALLTISIPHTTAVDWGKITNWLKQRGLKVLEKPPKLSPGTANNIYCSAACTKVCSKSLYRTKCTRLCFNCCKKCGNDNQCKC